MYPIWVRCLAYPRSPMLNSAGRISERQRTFGQFTRCLCSVCRGALSQLMKEAPP
jgi:hypothetical protein